MPFFIITNLPPQPFSDKYQMIFRCLKHFPANIKRYFAAPAVFRQISNDISPLQLFSGKYQTIFRRSSCFPVNIKRYLAILAVSRQILNDISLPKRFAGRYQMIFIVRTTHSRRMNRRRRAPRDSRENSPYEESFHFEKKFPL